jgi:hypothetical protein
LITAQAKVNGGYSAMGIFTGGSQVANTSVFNWYQPSGTVNNGLQGTWVLTVTTPTVYTINAWGGGTVSAGSDGTAVANYIQINPTFALTAISGLTTTSDVNVGGNLNVTGTGGNVLTKTSGMVAAGTFVTLDNLKATITTSGSRGLSIGAVSTSFDADINVVYTVSGGINGGSLNNQTYTTTASTSLFSLNFLGHGDTAQFNLRDKTNNRFYRITMMIGVSYISNFISIERLF